MRSIYVRTWNRLIGFFSLQFEIRLKVECYMMALVHTAKLLVFGYMLVCVCTVQLCMQTDTDELDHFW